MKIQSIIRAALLLAVALQLGVAAKPDPELEKLYRDKQYFELRDALSKLDRDKSGDLLFYRGAVSNKFNRPQASINYLQSYLKTAAAKAPVEFVKDSYLMLADNYVKTYQYRKAADAFKAIPARFARELDEEETEGIANGASLWGALADVPRQSVTLKGDSRIQTTKDKARLTNLPVRINNQTVSLVFDTGANISTATESFAKQWNFKIIEASIDVSTITGKSVKARLGIAPPMEIGSVVVRNAVFLIFDDKDLYFPQVDYQINAILGFPVIEAFREFTIAKNGELFIPAKARSRGRQNMCLDELTPLVQATHRGRSLTFSFDTGAQSSSLNRPFYEAFEDEIKAKHTAQTGRIGGAGGSREVEMYRLPSFDINISGRDVRLPNVKVLTETGNKNSHFLHGNLGQDLIRQFERMTINFEAMSLVFE